MDRPRTAVGVFSDHNHAQQAVNDLRKAGFTEEQIGVAARHGDAVEGTHDVTDEGSNAAAGAATGLAAGAGIGALWGMGIVAGLLPAIGPAIAGGTLAAILSSAAAGAAAAGLAGALIGLGVPEDEAKYYEGEFHSGRTIVTVKSGDRYDEALAILQRHQGYDFTLANESGASQSGNATQTSAAKTAGRATASRAATTKNSGTIQAREEELHVEKRPVETGEVRVRKEVHTEHKSIDVPVRKEEVVIERHAVSGHEASSSNIQEGEEIRIPVSEEQISVHKTPVVKEEVRVGKRQVKGTETVSDTVRKEEIKIDKQGDVDVREKRD